MYLVLCLRVFLCRDIEEFYDVYVFSLPRRDPPAMPRRLAGIRSPDARCLGHCSAVRQRILVPSWGGVREAHLGSSRTTCCCDLAAAQDWETSWPSGSGWNTYNQPQPLLRCHGGTRTLHGGLTAMTAHETTHSVEHAALASRKDSCARQFESEPPVTTRVARIEHLCNKSISPPIEPDQEDIIESLTRCVRSPGERKGAKQLCPGSFFSP